MTFRPRTLRNRYVADGGIWPVVVIVVLISIYPVLRYGGWWNVGGDTVNFTIAIRSVLETGQIAPSDRQIYPNGYGFQALSVFLLHVAGVSLPNLQVFGGVLLIIWMVFPAWLLYREWVGSGRGATLATMLLFSQPDFLFAIMRGTHEKFTRGLMLLCLFLLAYSLRSRMDVRQFTASVFAFYLIMFGLITFNNFFSTSLIFAVFLALGIYWLLAWRMKLTTVLNVAMRRMAVVVAASLVLAFVYTFYIYDPATRNLSILESIVEQVRALFLPSETEERYNPYAEAVFRNWISPYVYLALNLANGLIVVGAGLIWSVQGMRWLRGRERPASDIALMPWAFFAAFAFQGAFAILADISGALAGNLQHRMIASIGLVGAPLIARWIISVLETRRRTVVRLAQIGIWATVGTLALLAVTKATNEPVLSNQWQTYLPAELEAVRWADQSLADRSLWTGHDRRVTEAVDTQSGATPRNVFLDQFEVDPGTHDFMISSLTRVQARRLGLPLPTDADDFLTFDNGEVQIFHRRPETLYEP